MITLGTDEIIKYPFLAEGGQFLKDKGFSLEQFGLDPDLKNIVDNAYQRIETAANGNIYKSNLQSGSSTESNLSLEVFSFLIAVILLKLSGKNTLIQRFSLAEARRAEKFLEKDLQHSDDNTEKLGIKIISELFSMNVEKQDGNFVVLISDYLKHSVHFHEREWKLVNRHVDNGKVFLTSHEAVRLVRKELASYIRKKINSMSLPPGLDGFDDTVKKLGAIAKKFQVNIVESSEYPPCIKYAIEVLEKGENLPHSGRFLLATFLLGKGQTVEQISPLFKNAPDYNEKVTLYQLRHLAGDQGSTTKYACPSCEKVKSNNLCFPVPACDKIINPIQFGRKIDA